MNTKKILCAPLSVYLPNKIESIINNIITPISGYTPVKFEIKSGNITETTTMSDAGKLVTQRLEAKAKLLNTGINNFNQKIIVELNIDKVGQQIWGTIALPVIIKEISNSDDGFKLIFERKTIEAEFI